MKEVESGLRRRLQFRILSRACKHRELVRECPNSTLILFNNENCAIADVARTKCHEVLQRTERQSVVIVHREFGSN